MLSGLLSENGISRRSSTTPQSAGNTNYGSLFFNSPRSTRTAAIIMLP
ncbi:MAG: hypothetical protein HFH75_00930 [Lachnospiraceae bacterium]|nr:hypothetical protein [Lachnospiraceae bacterium]